MQYTKIDSTAFTKLQLNAGIMVDSFNPETAVIGNILGATSGGFQFASNPEFVDFGEDIDNVPANTKQLKRIKSFDPSISGTFLSVTADLAKQLVGGGASLSGTHVIPTHDLTDDDFADIWIIGDYSDKNTGTSAGFMALHLKNALNTGGFQWQSSKDEKGQFSFEFHGHYDIADVEEVPFELYVKSGAAATLASVTVTSAAGTATGDTKITLSDYTLKSGERWVHKTAKTTAPSVTFDEKLSGWTEIASGDDITPAATHDKITVAAVDSRIRAVASGSATIVTNVQA